jgi:peptidoglycan/xylan/chitin deacetylase (PgdA/CDA1 family)
LRHALPREEKVVSRPLVLAYHGFGCRSAEQDPQNLFVTRAAFEEQLDRLHARGRQAMSLDDYLDGFRRRRWPKGSFLVTIDDGYVSTLELAAPILAARGVPAVVFVPAALIGKASCWMEEMPDEPLLDADQLRELGSYRIAIGAHGMEHDHMAGMDEGTLWRNTTQAREALADISGVAPKAFAFPFGTFDAAAVTAVRRAGYGAAFALATTDDRFAVRRVGVNATDNHRTFGLKMQPWWSLAEHVGRTAPRLRRGLHRLVGSER